LDKSPIQCRLGQGIATFGQSYPIEGLGAGIHHHHGIRVGQAHILPRQNQHPPQDKARIFPGIHHPRQPIHRRIGVRTAQAFDKRANRIEMGIAFLVVQHGPMLNRFLGDAEGEVDDAVGIGQGRGDRQFEGI
jgi:hypothetical protein